MECIRSLVRIGLATASLILASTLTSTRALALDSPAPKLHSTFTFPPALAIGFENEFLSGCTGQDLTTMVSTRDGVWAPVVNPCVSVDYFATGSSGGYLDALSLEFDLFTAVPSLITSLTLRLYAKRGDYSPLWHAIRLYPGPENPQDQDCDDAQRCWTSADEFPGTDGWQGWIERPVPLAWINGNTLMLTARMWNARIDAVELVVETDSVPSPTLVAVRDVAGDQGGRVIVAWDASGRDRPGMRYITGYRVWRRALLPADATTNAMSTFTDATPKLVAEGPLTTYWESVAELPAAYLEGYAYAAETLQDSTELGNPYTAFFVQALTADPFVFFSSNVDSGYSVDNLAPPQPVPFVGEYGATEVVLHWTQSRATDFREFRLYRGVEPDFVPGPSNLVLATRDTGYVDTPPHTAIAHYKLAAVDIHGNVSRFAAISPESPVATLVSLASVDALEDRIRLRWYANGKAQLTATLYRHDPAGGWARLVTLQSDGSGYLRYEDRSVVPGKRYGYRLGIFDGGSEVFAGEVWVTAENPRLALEGVRPNPAPRNRLVTYFVLPSSAPARLELLDVAGRRIVLREVGGLGPGRHSVDLAEGAALAQGIYFVRLTHGARQLTTRLAVME